LESSLTLKWLKPADSLTGGLTIAGYYLKINSGYDTEYTSELHEASGLDLLYTFTNLIEGVTYKAIITAYNSLESNNA
jgi:hypothetical protein